MGGKKIPTTVLGSIGCTSLYAQVLQREKDILVVVSEWISDSLFTTSWLICIRKRHVVVAV